MPQTGTLAALLAPFSKRRTVNADVTLTPADIGSVILVDTGGGSVDVELPSIPGNTALGDVSLTDGAFIGVIKIDAANAVDVQAPNVAVPDTFNGDICRAPA